MDVPTLLFLLKGGHLNMADRIARGLWPHPPLMLDAVTDYLAGVLESGEAWFPRPFEPARGDGAVWEGGVIERQAADPYFYRIQAHHPLSPVTITSACQRV